MEIPFLSLLTLETREVALTQFFRIEKVNS